MQSIPTIAMATARLTSGRRARAVRGRQLTTQPRSQSPACVAHPAVAIGLIQRSVHSNGLWEVAGRGDNPWERHTCAWCSLLNSTQRRDASTSNRRIFFHRFWIGWSYTPFACTGARAKFKSDAGEVGARPVIPQTASARHLTPQTGWLPDTPSSVKPKHGRMAGGRQVHKAEFCSQTPRRPCRG